MKHIIILFFLCLISCDNTKQKPQALKSLTTAQKIANVHGFNNWKNVSEIHFTFNIDRDTTHYERQWSWRPKTNMVSKYDDDTIIRYKRSNLDSSLISIDKRFINDKFWLLIPFQLVWDTGTKITEPQNAIAPLSNKELNKITLLYEDKGGYTPGDAYDIYFDDTYLIREWVYRKANSEKPTLSTTFEDYQDFGGIKIATSHRKNDGDWNLSFTNIKINP